MWRQILQSVDHGKPGTSTSTSILVPQTKRYKKYRNFSSTNSYFLTILGPWKLLPTWCEFIKSGLPIGQSRWHVKNLHFRLLCCRFNFRQRTFNRGWWSSRGHRCNHGKKKNLIFSKFKFAASCGAFFWVQTQVVLGRASQELLELLEVCVSCVNASNVTCLLTFRPHANSN